MKKGPIILFFLFAGMFIYLLLRAIYVPFTHDEAATFFRFVHTGRFWPFLSEWSTNNHILNSALTFVSYKLLGPSPLAQRLPNLLFIPLYFWFLWRLSGYLRADLLRWVFILSLLLAHQFIDFFSLSRGYGMAMTLLTGGILYVVRALENGRTADTALATVLMFLAVTAHLLLINTFILTIAVLVAGTLLNRNRKRSATVATASILLVSGLALSGLTIAYLLGMQEAGRIDYGGDQGFWAFTVTALNAFLFDPFPRAANTLTLVFAAILVLAWALLAAKGCRRLPERASLPAIVFTFLLAGNIAATVLEHHLFGVLYPDARASIPLYLLFMGALLFTLDRVPGAAAWKALAVAPLALLPLHFLTAANLRFSASDTHNYNIPEAFYDTIAAAPRPGGYPPTVQGYQLRTMRWNFMNFRRQGELGTLHYSTYPSLAGDFQVVVPGDHPAWLGDYSVAAVAADSHLALLRRANPLARLPLDSGLVAGEAAQRDTYFALFTAPVDTLVGTSLYLGFTLRLTSEEAPFTAWVVAEVRDGDDNLLAYEYCPLDWFRTRWDADTPPFVNGLLIDGVPPGAKMLRCYLWNIHEAEYMIVTADMKLFLLGADTRERP